MAGGRFSKNAIYSGVKYWNNPFYDGAPGGQITSAPAGLVVGQGEQTLPGDRTIFSPLDALVYSNNASGGPGNLYTGTYRYVQFKNNSTSSPTRGHAAFWDITVADAQYQVTSDEPASLLFAGVFINTPAASGANAWWWIQECGKVSAKFRTAVTTAGAIGAGVYLYAGGNNANAADVATFDTTAVSSGNATGTQMDAAITKYVGQQEVAATNNNISLVDIPFSKGGYRW